MNVYGFRGQYRFLSNFWPVQVSLDGEIYPTVEHAYQAAKTLEDGARDKIRKCATPGQAKRLGRAAALRPDWDGIKLEIMLNLLRQKFSDPQLRIDLLATGIGDLREDNNWNDTFWGVCNGLGQNHLGKLLMRIRDELAEA